MLTLIGLGPSSSKDGLSLGAWEALKKADTTGNGIAVNPISFYDQVGDSKVIAQCAISLKFPDGTTTSVTAQSLPIAFMKPTVTAWAVNTGTPGPQKNMPPSGVNAGTTTDANGISEFTMYADEIWGPITISVPQLGTTPIGGLGGIAQIVATAGDVDTRIPIGNAPSTFVDIALNASGKAVAEPTPALDAGFPYPFGYNADANGIMIPTQTDSSEWNVSQSGYSGDEPYTPIFPPGGPGGNNWTKSVFAHTFNTYVMYQPPGGDVQQVPLYKMPWTWAATISKPAGGWASTDGILAGTVTSTSAAPAYQHIVWSLLESNTIGSGW